MPRKDYDQARAYARAYYMKNIDKMREYQRARRRKHPEFSRSAARRHYWRNRDKILQVARDKYHSVPPSERKPTGQSYYLNPKGGFKPKCPYCENPMRVFEWHDEIYLRCGGCGLETTPKEIRRIQIWEAA